MTRMAERNAAGKALEAELAPDRDLIARIDEAQDFARDLLDDVGIGFVRRQQGDVALKIGAHGLKAFDLELQQC